MDAALAEHIPASLEAFRNRFVSKEPAPEADAAAEPAPAEEAAPPGSP
jgi:hypothetical protein